MSLGLIVEVSVAILLATTIGYLVILNHRLKRLRADRAELQAMVRDLVAATELADRAIAGLRSAAGECEANITERLAEAERFTVDMAYHVTSGQAVLEKIARITQAVAAHREARDAEPQPPAPSRSAEALENLKHLHERGMAA